MRPKPRAEQLRALDDEDFYTEASLEDGGAVLCFDPRVDPLPAAGRPRTRPSLHRPPPRRRLSR